MGLFKKLFKKPNVTLEVGTSTMETIQGTDVKDRIAQDLARYPILLYIKGTKEEPQCGFSHAVIDIFKKLSVPFETIDVLSDPEIREGVKAFTNWPTVPQVFIKGEFIGGCDIVKDLHSKGELEPLVKQAIGS